MHVSQEIRIACPVASWAGEGGGGGRVGGGSCSWTPDLLVDLLHRLDCRGRHLNQLNSGGAVCSLIDTVDRAEANHKVRPSSMHVYQEILTCPLSSGVTGERGGWEGRRRQLPVDAGPRGCQIMLQLILCYNYASNNGSRVSQ